MASAGWWAIRTRREIADIVDQPPNITGKSLLATSPPSKQFLAAPVRDVREDRTRPNLKIQDGCSNRCSFCIIPERARPQPQRTARQCDRAGARLGQPLLRSGPERDQPGPLGARLPGGLRFVDLLRAILREDFCSATAHQFGRADGLEPGSARTRGLRTADCQARPPPAAIGFRCSVEAHVPKIPHSPLCQPLSLAHSLMPRRCHRCGRDDRFPWRNGRRVRRDIRFHQQQPFTYLHVFTYSERPGTARHSRDLPSQSLSVRNAPESSATSPTKRI